jgi:AbrB family looped-hinge helix DNA binding protein
MSISALITTVSPKSMVTIPAEVAQRFDIKPGWKLEWQPVEGTNEIVVRVIPAGGNKPGVFLGEAASSPPSRWRGGTGCRGEAKG